MKNNKILIALLPLFFISGCLGLKKDTEKGNPLPTKIQVHWIGPLTGNTKILGIDNEKAVRMVINRYNQNKSSSMPELEYFSHDDQYNDQKTEKIFNEINQKDQKTAKVFFAITYEAMKKLAPKLKKKNTVLFNALDNDLKLQKLSKNMILMAKRTEQMARILSKHTIKDQMKKLAVLYFSGDSFMPTLAAETRHLVEKKGGRASLFPYPAGVKKFADIIGPDTVKIMDGVALYGYAEMEQAVLYLKSINPALKLYSVNTALSLTGKENLKALIEGMKVAHFTKADGNTKLAERLIDDYTSLYKAPPLVDWIAFQAYDSAKLLVESIKVIYSQENKRKINWSTLLLSQLKSNKVYKGASGNISINSDGAAEGIYMSIYQLKNGIPVRLENNHAD